MRKITLSILIWNALYSLDQSVGFLRGLFYRLCLRVKGQPHFLIGNCSRNFFERNAQIILTSDQDERKSKIPISPIVSLGLLNERSLQNPPSRLSRFRIGTNSVVEFKGPSKIGPGFYLSVMNNSRFIIGRWTYVGNDFTVLCRNSIKIGEECMLSHGVTLMDYDGHPVVSATSSDTKDSLIQHGLSSTNSVGGASQGIEIANNVWIGMNVTILKGVKIGSGSIVASNSVVTHSMPENSLIAGSPAKVMRQNVTWEP